MILALRLVGIGGAKREGGDRETPRKPARQPGRRKHRLEQVKCPEKEPEGNPQWRQD